jgi:tight adherence protein B
MLTPTVISVIAFLVVTALVGLLAFVFRDTSPKTATRLELLVGKRRREDDEKADILRKAAFEGDRKTFIEFFMPKFLSLRKLFEQADCHISPQTLFGIGILLACAAATVSLLLRLPLWLVPINGALLFGVPWMWLWNKRQARMKKFGTQLPDALELVARALRAGHSLGAGMHVVAEEMPAPIADEFNRVYEEQNLGISAEESLRNLCERVPNLDLRFFVTSVIIQRQTGGDLAEILDKIGYVIRERFRILGQVQALTGEGRLSGIVLIALPFALFFFMLNSQPDYIAKLWTTELGQQMSMVAIVMQILGAICIRKIVNIKV